MHDGSPRPAAVVYNPIKVDARRHQEGRPRTSRRPAGARPSGTRPRSTTRAAASRRRPSPTGADMVIAAGGDGTVRAVAEALRGTGRAARPAALGHRQPARPQPRAAARPPRRRDRDRVHRRRPPDRPRASSTSSTPDGTRDRTRFVVMAGLGLDAQDDREHQRRAQEARRLARLRRRASPARCRDDNRIDDPLRPRRTAAARSMKRAHDHRRQLRRCCPATSCCCPTPRSTTASSTSSALRPERLVRLGRDLAQDRLGERRAAPSRVGRKIIGRAARSRRPLHEGHRDSSCGSTPRRTSSSTATQFGEAVACARGSTRALTVRVPADSESRGRRARPSAGLDSPPRSARAASRAPRRTPRCRSAA